MKYVLVGVLVLALASTVSVWQFGQVRRDLSARHNAIQAAWEEVDVSLRQRAELVPRMAALVQQRAKADPDVLRRIALATGQILSDVSPQDKITAYTDLNTALVPLLVTVHRTPIAYRSDFQVLNYELESNENRIAHTRSLYNDAVQKYNTKLRLFPGNLVGYLSSYQPEAAYFKTEVASVPPELPRKTKAKSHK